MDNAQTQLSTELMKGLAKLFSGVGNEEVLTGHVGIKRDGEKIIVPTGMDLTTAAATLIDIAAQEEQITSFSKTFRYVPHDGANALDAVLTELYGRAPAKNIPGMFGSSPPEQISIKTGPHEEKMVLWGRFALPGLDGGFIDTDYSLLNGMYVFSLSATVRKKHKAKVEAIFSLVEQYLESNSIYNGKAIKVGFRDEDGDPLQMLNIEFLDTDLIDPSQLIYSDSVFDEIDTYLFTPLRRPADCVANNIALKRGICLAGTYGTGKTLAASAASKFAVQSGMTYVYCQRANEIVDGMNFAKMYQKVACVLFAEDIDRQTAGARTVTIDDVLNNIDGIESKYSKIITVFTTNDVDSINPGMIRPGRLDAVIEVSPPDAKAAEKLVRMYAGAALDSATDITSVGKELDGQIPAVINEVVKRAKLQQLRMQAPGEPVTKLSVDAFMRAASSIKRQVAMIYAERRNDDAAKLALLTDMYNNGIHNAVAAMLSKVGVKTDHPSVNAELVIPASLTK